MHTTHSPWWDAKNRHNLPDELPFDYSQIAHIFENKPMNQAPQTPIESSKIQQPKNEPVKQPEPPKENKQEIKQEPTKQQQTPITQPNNNLKGLPKALVDLMETNKVTAGEIQLAVGKRGYYTADTPITNYDPDFIKGVLIGAWGQLYNIILEIRSENDIFTPVDGEEIPF